MISSVIRTGKVFSTPNSGESAGLILTYFISCVGRIAMIPEILVIFYGVVNGVFICFCPTAAIYGGKRSGV